MLSHSSGLTEREQTKNIEALGEEKLNYKSNGKEIFLLVGMRRSKNGHKWIELAKKDKRAGFGLVFPNISVPNDAYLLVNAMDTLLNKSVDDDKVWALYMGVGGGRAETI